MEKTYKRVPFDIELAKKIQAGEIEGKVKTRRGENVRIVCLDRKNEHHTPIVALIDNIQREELYFYSEAGEYDFGSNPMLDLVLEVPDNAPEEPQFKPFDRVLVRDKDDEVWHISLYESYGNDGFYVFHGSYCRQCIPYEGNQELVGTSNKPKED